MGEEVWDMKRDDDLTTVAVDILFQRRNARTADEDVQAPVHLTLGIIKAFLAAGSS